MYAARGQATDGTGGLVEARDMEIPGMIGRTLVYGPNRGHLLKADRRIDKAFVPVEAHAHMGDLSFSLSAKYADEARARLAEAMFARLRLRQQNEIPSIPGICIGRAVFVEPLPARKAEHPRPVGRHLVQHPPASERSPATRRPARDRTHAICRKPA